MIKKSKYRKALLMLPLLVVAYLGVSIQPAAAAYVQHNLVDDNIFLNANSMNRAQIQSFLAARGSYLANYSSYSGRDGTNVLASQIIYEAAQDYGINPQVILATLQKEQSLVTATNPTSTQLQRAMGYGCPDSAQCDSKYYGLYNQVDNGAWQFRKNFERARGNNDWWSSSRGYACGGTTRYYSTGLYVGRNVTFYDDSGKTIQNFTINNASTASLYCYTPHPYNNPNGLYGNPAYGYTGQYYSGSYNFVLWFERWFGSTQPALQVASPLRVSTVPQGVYAGVATTASFDIVNNTNATQTVSVAVTARNGSGQNVDFSLKSLTIGPFGRATYSDTQTFATEGNYTFGMTSYVNGTWSDSYPSGSSIDNVRTKVVNVQTMPTITATPVFSASSVHAGQTVTATFKIRNNSQSSFNPGQVALAMRDATGRNVDLPLVSTGSIASGAEYTYSQAFIPQATGRYTGIIVATNDGGGTWNDSDYPRSANGISRSVQVEVKPPVTIVNSVSTSNASPRVGQGASLSFNLRNFGNSAVNLGHVGLAGRDPNGRNVDPGVVPVTLAAGETKTLSFPVTFNTAGTYKYSIASTSDFSNWGTGPNVEDDSVAKNMTVGVRAGVTVTSAPVSTIPSPYSNESASLSFNLRNFGNSAVNLGHVGLAGRDPNGRNVDPGVVPVTLAAGETKTLSFPVTFNTAGTYKYSIASTSDFSNWGTGPNVEDDSVAKTLQLNVKNPVVTNTSLVSSISSPQKGQSVALSFTVKNLSGSSVNLGHVGLAGRDPNGRNVDPGVVPVTLAAGETKTLSFNTLPLSLTGNYNFNVISTSDFSTWGTGPVADSDVNKTLRLTVN